jgi:hypothetical protein
MSNHTIYMISYHEEDTPSGVAREWFTTFNKADKRLRQLKLTDSERVNVVEVPKTKIGLVEWLNTHGSNG